MISNEIRKCVRTIQHDSYTCRCVLLTYRHTDCTNKRTNSNKERSNPRQEFSYITHGFYPNATLNDDYANLSHDAHPT